MKQLTEMLRERATDFPDLGLVNDLSEQSGHTDLDAQFVIERDAAWAVLAEMATELEWATVRPAFVRLACRHRIGSADDRAAQAWALYSERVVHALDLSNAP